jgi:hypothetical protein
MNKTLGEDFELPNRGWDIAVPNRIGSCTLLPIHGHEGHELRLPTAGVGEKLLELGY